MATTSTQTEKKMQQPKFRAASVSMNQGWYAQILITAFSGPDFYQTIESSPYFKSPDMAVSWAVNVWS